MINRYSYIIEDNTIEKELISSFYEKGSFEDAISFGVNTEKVTEILISERNGEAFSNIIKKEEEWYSIKKKILKLNIDIEKANEEEIEDLKKEQNNLTNSLSELESLNPFLLSLTDSSIEKVLDIDYKLTKDEQKLIISKSRDQKVRSVEDSIADLAKMNSLLFSCISAMYGTMTDTTKAKIDAGTKELIDYSVEKFSETQTRADRQLMKEGTGLVDKLFEREVQIADIIDEVKGE